MSMHGKSALSGSIEHGRHVLTIRVYYGDTDFSAQIYHGSYVRFLERGRTELLRSHSASQRDLHRDMGGLAFVVRRMTLEYLKPGHMDDVLTVLTWPREVHGASMILSQEIRRGDDRLLTAEVTVAAVRDGRAVRIPKELRMALASLGS